jgi:hypothetical protein
VQVWTFTTTVAFTLDEEGAHFRLVAFIIWIRSCKRFQHLLSCRGGVDSQIRLVSFQLKETHQMNFTGKEESQRVMHLTLHVLSIILPVYITCRGFVLYTKRCVPNLRRQAILQVKQTSLAHVLHLGACLANHGGFEACALARIPAKDGKRTGTCAT